MKYGNHSMFSAFLSCRSYRGRHGLHRGAHRHIFLLHFVRPGASRIQRERCDRGLQLFSEENNPHHSYLLRTAAGVLPLSPVQSLHCNTLIAWSMSFCVRGTWSIIMKSAVAEHLPFSDVFSLTFFPMYGQTSNRVFWVLVGLCLYGQHLRFGGLHVPRLLPQPDMGVQRRNCHHLVGASECSKLYWS